MLTKDRLEKLYWEDGLSIRKIAELFDTNYHAVRNLFDEYSIPKRSNYKDNPKRIPRMKLYKLYFEKEMTLAEIGEAVGASGSVVMDWMRYYGFETRDAVVREPKHGMAETPEYRAWHAMNQRCHNPNLPNYKDYGERGIQVCDRWRGDFRNFIEDMGEKPEPKELYSLDRIDNDGNYEPGNCRWTTMDVQIRNQRVKKTNRTGVRGVHWCNTVNAYVARIQVAGRSIYLGQFDSLDEASEVRRQAELKYWGKSS